MANPFEDREIVKRAIKTFITTVKTAAVEFDAAWAEVSKWDQDRKDAVKGLMTAGGQETFDGEVARTAAIRDCIAYIRQKFPNPTPPPL